MLKRANIRVNGIVQGVGFRPFIHKQVSSRKLTGWVRNTSSGAEIELEGEEQEINDFASELRHHGPRLSLIAAVHVEFLPDMAGYNDFRIIESKGEKKRNTLISPDVCICEDCLEEMYSPGRRYRYPFINCTNCGPRFTIIRDVPYDRRQTTMGVFTMCPDCHHEYTDIEDRRYHAEPTGCNLCGPSLQLLDAEGRLISDKTVTGPGLPLDEDPVELARRILLTGGIVAVKGLGGYHLACRVDDPDVVTTLRRRKHRDEKPFAIMCRDVEATREYCLVSPEEERILTGHRRPIVLLRKKPGVSLGAVSENGRIGVMLPYTPVHYMLFEKDIRALVMTSANLSDLPILFKDDDAVKALQGIADAFLINNREIHVRCDDSLCYVYDGREYPVRRSRGYVPYPIILNDSVVLEAGSVAEAGEDPALPPVLACGAEQKASFTLSRGSYAFPSQHIGDMKNIETLENYESQIKHFERIYDIQPAVLACDLHPDYISTEYAVRRSLQEDIPLIQIQHHHAHMASCMADNDLTGQVIGIIWDGVGYGEDGNAWGGEFLTGGYDGYKRQGHIRYIRLPGGDRATRELWRTGISLMLEAGVEPESICEVRNERGGGAGNAGTYAPENAGEAGNEPVFTAEQIAAVRRQLQLGINCPLSSGMGRLFDGVAAILGIKTLAGYEGQGAILLEAAAGTSQMALEYDIINRFGIYELDWGPMIRDLCSRLTAGEVPEVLAAAFMNTLAEAGAEIAGRIAADTGLNRVVLSGGTFNNMYLMDRLPDMLGQRGLTVYHHHRVSCGDEGLSLGQLLIASRKYTSGI